MVRIAPASARNEVGRTQAGCTQSSASSAWRYTAFRPRQPRYRYLITGILTHAHKKKKKYKKRRRRTRRRRQTNRQTTQQANNEKKQTNKKKRTRRTRTKTRRGKRKKKKKREKKTHQQPKRKSDRENEIIPLLLNERRQIHLRVSIVVGAACITSDVAVGKMAGGC